MKVLIVEDETAAYENLTDILTEITPDIRIMANTESVTQTVGWLQSNPAPDLIFMDIHLSDGSAFAIFDRIELETPIIFTTAYDRYAIEAFKVNSIDYLLKPVKVEDIPPEQMKEIATTLAIRFAKALGYEPVEPVKDTKNIG